MIVWCLIVCEESWIWWYIECASWNLKSAKKDLELRKYWATYFTLFDFIFCVYSTFRDEDLWFMELLAFYWIQHCNLQGRWIGGVCLLNVGYDCWAVKFD